MGRSKETMARLFGLGIPRGGSKLPMKSDIWLKVMNWVAWGSNLGKLIRMIDPGILDCWSQIRIDAISLFDKCCLRGKSLELTSQGSFS